MDVKFDKTYLQELYEDGKATSKKYRFQPDVGKYVCARAIHPGEILKEEIEYRGISQNKLAAQMGISYKMLNHILNERRSLTTQTALLFEAALGISASLLIGIQTDYNLQTASNDKSFSARLAEVHKMTALI